MTQTRETTLKESLKIQRRVIRALLLREMITRYGRNNLGFLWLFVEPLLVTMVIALIWKFVRGSHITDINIVAFMITGYPMMMLWRKSSGKAIGAVSANIGLLYHRNVRVFDLLLSRIILEVASVTVAQIAIMLLFIFIGWIDLPADIFYMIIAWLLMACFGLGLGFVLYAISCKSEVFGKVWNA
ncbi:MAG: ABC transporter permease, partial [Neisseriaceae bacterium]|nr:ABC transporter permease [Neisseriaceae bacterium]